RDFHVTGVQTCALPIYLRLVRLIRTGAAVPAPRTLVTHRAPPATRCRSRRTGTAAPRLGWWSHAHRARSRGPRGREGEARRCRRSEERRVGKGRRARGG